MSTRFFSLGRGVPTCSCRRVSAHTTSGSNRRKGTKMFRNCSRQRSYVISTLKYSALESIAPVVSINHVGNIVRETVPDWVAAYPPRNCDGRLDSGARKPDEAR